MQRFVIFCLFSCVACFDFRPQETQSTAFDVKPGGQVGVYENEWQGFKCKFTYQSQGGTKEQWEMRQQMSESGQEFLCQVERGESYLFFQSFQLEVSGASAQEAAAYGEGQNPLGAKEYKFDPKTGIVKDVPGAYGNHLTSVAIYAKKSSKNEL